MILSLETCKTNQKDHLDMRWTYGMPGFAIWKAFSKEKIFKFFTKFGNF